MSGFEDFPLVSGSRYKPIVLAHRGDHRTHKPNSLLAVTSSLSSGADGAEVDLRLGAEGGVFLSHDPVQKGYQLAGAREEDAELEKLSICTLDKVLASSPGEMLLNLELKRDPLGRVEDFAESVLSKCGPYVSSKRLLFSSFRSKVSRVTKNQGSRGEDRTPPGVQDIGGSFDLLRQRTGPFRPESPLPEGPRQVAGALLGSRTKGKCLDFRR